MSIKEPPKNPIRDFLPRAFAAEYSLPEFEPGSVWLVGAGPGDPGLLTLLACHALAGADAVVYDALVDRRVLTLTPEGARRVYVGKRKGQITLSQDEIAQLLIRLARDGLRVVRLKGGDPFVFGRGGEEALALIAHGIELRVVPGISAGVGGLAYAGIPVTQREINSVVTFVTAHRTGGTMPDGIDWQALARGSPVLVIFMGLSRLQRVCARLIEAGRAPGERMAVISRATTERQAVLETTLGAAPVEALEAKIEGPAIIVLGEVVRLHELISWFRPVSDTIAGASTDAPGGHAIGEGEAEDGAENSDDDEA